MNKKQRIKEASKIIDNIEKIEKKIRRLEKGDHFLKLHPVNHRYDHYKKSEEVKINDYDIVDDIKDYIIKILKKELSKLEDKLNEI